MPSERLYLHFTRLSQQLPTGEAELTLPELAALLCCTPRNARLLLRRMEQAGWLCWQASAGRGHRARLTLRRNQQQMRQQQLAALVVEGKLEQALLLVQGRTEQLLPHLLAYASRSDPGGRQILRVPYYRPLPYLVPDVPLRRSEVHLVRQIFSGLVRRNEENGEIEPELAHHWEQLEARRWRFYLRPAVRFQHGRLLQAEDVCESLGSLSGYPLFQHLERVEAISPRAVDIHLREPDPWLLQLLCEAQALILPREWRSLPDFALQPVGCGPYRVVRNDPQRLQLEAFDDYFGLRALLDEIDIWMLPKLAERLTCQLRLAPERADLGQRRAESGLEAGCYFLLSDDRSPWLREESLRHWLAATLDPIALMAGMARELQQILTPALGLLPHWRDLPLPAKVERPAALPARLVVACFNQHLEFRELAGAMAGLLASHGVALELRELDYSRWARGEDEDVDLWLGTVNLEHDRDFAAYTWLQGVPLLRAAWSSLEPLWAQLSDWRSQGARPGPRQWLRQRQSESRFLPLFHHWLELESRSGVHGLRMTALGWFDFRHAWLKPDNGGHD